MAAIDLIVLGMIRQQPRSAYDIQKLVEYRSLSKWVKISTPSIYKKVLQLEEKGYIQSRLVREGKMAEKAVYSLTPTGNEAFERLMLNISQQPIHLFLDLNAVIVNLDSLPPEKQRACIDGIEEGVRHLKASLEENLRLKSASPEIPETAKAVLNQQYILAQAIESWVSSVRKLLP
ncbi:MAG: PadR family transcriptional regulator [Clostridiales bacterium]|nr:PadR family transcriptional regulator [Clostridiales bacterium]